MKKKWWMESFGYQIYIKSFFDTNGDGIGDLEGVYQKLDYLHHLGINLIWLVPFYDSPMDDNGYDVRDFYKVSKEYGTIEHFDKIIKRAKELGIKVIIDLILNHTSDEHHWFMESRKSLDNKYREYYIWQPPRIINGIEVEPTNWASFFGGSAWKKDKITGEYFMKIFSDKMPDLNWESTLVQDEMVKMATWWIERGADGFRIDAASHLTRAPFEDSTLSNERYVGDWSKISNLPKVHDYLQILKDRVFSKYDIVTVGEVGGGAPVESGLRYASFDNGQLDMVFNFDHNWCVIDKNGTRRTDLIRLKEVFKKWQDGFKDRGWNPLYWLNHDHPRVMSMYGDINFHKESGKMLANALYLMRGTPFIYQGEEIGMTNFPFKKLEQFRDVSTINPIKLILKEDPTADIDKLIAKRQGSSRDQARTPMQWDETLNAGFTKGNPWIEVNPNYKEINVKKSLLDKDSILNHYRKVIDLKLNSKYKDTLIYGTFEIIDFNNKYVYAYLRKTNKETILVVNSFSNKIRHFKLGNYQLEDIILSNYDNSHIYPTFIKLRPFESIVMTVKLTKK